MPTVHPLARPEFLPELAPAFIPDGDSLIFLADGATVDFMAEPAVAFDFAPFAVEVAPADSYSIRNEDTGQVLYNEDTGQTFIMEEAT